MVESAADFRPNNFVRVCEFEILRKSNVHVELLGASVVLHTHGKRHSHILHRGITQISLTCEICCK